MPGGDQNMHLRGHMLNKRRHHLVDVFISNRVVIIEAKHEIVFDFGDFVYQGGQDFTSLNADVGRPEKRRRGVAGTGSNPIQSGSEISEKSHRITVGRVQGQPGELAVPAGIGLTPFAYQRALAGARRRGDQRQRAFKTSIDEIGEPRTANYFRAYRGEMELCPE